jgi:hypothetical protein
VRDLGGQDGAGPKPSSLTGAIVTDWLPIGTVLSSLETEANATALRLGHTLCQWLRIGDRERRSRCITCQASAVIRARQFRGAPMGGEALTFRCAGRRP